MKAWKVTHAHHLDNLRETGEAVSFVHAETGNRARSLALGDAWAGWEPDDYPQLRAHRLPAFDDRPFTLYALLVAGEYQWVECFWCNAPCYGEYAVPDMDTYNEEPYTTEDGQPWTDGKGRVYCSEACKVSDHYRLYHSVPVSQNKGYYDPLLPPADGGFLQTRTVIGPSLDATPEQVREFLGSWRVVPVAHVQGGKDGKRYIGRADVILPAALAPVVCHVREGIEGAVYIGRENGRAGLKRSIWHNPYKIRPDASYSERCDAVIAFSDHLKSSPDLMARIPELVGKPLACWCKRTTGIDRAGRWHERGELCHGDVLALEVARYLHRERYGVWSAN